MIYPFGDSPITKTISTYLALLAVLLSPMAANADLIVSNASFDLSVDESGGDFLSGSDSGSFGLPPFDPSLGTLDSVILSLSYVLSDEATATVRLTVPLDPSHV